VTYAACLLLLAGCSSTPEAAGPVEPSSTTGPSTTGPSTTGPSTIPPPDPTGTGPASLPPYLASVTPVSDSLARRMRYSHRDGCPVALSDLRRLRMSFVGFDGRAHRGEMVVHEDHAAGVAQVFETLYEARWPIRRMRLVDAYGGDDDRSMAADNTSGYNCRTVAGTDRWSDHALGAAVDVNPVENPYVQGATVAPPRGRRYAALDRSPGAVVPAGVIHDGDLVVDAFAAIGWKWGGHWSGAKDYQHFSASGS
jgi:poly-gamma-glutamate synthesis protein (capsule biosynthesis protein)